LQLNQIAVAVIAGAGIVAAAVLFSSGMLSGLGEEPPHRAFVREQMVDPDSARFRNERKHSILDIHCGEVNGRNRMGGYAGWQHYTVFAPVGGLGWRVQFFGPAGPPFEACR